MMPSIPAMRSMASIGGTTQVVGVVGWPVEHSVSPAMHNAAFSALDLDWCYVALPVAPGNLPEALAGVRALGLRGINITVPHKQAALICMDELTPAAKAIGAMNTLIIRDGRMIGHNTDASGFLRALRQAGFDPNQCRALVLGAGGAARAVVYALGTEGAEVTILNRSPQRAQELAHEFGSAVNTTKVSGGVLNLENLQKASQGIDLIVNATPLGMWPHVEHSPWIEGVEIPGQTFCFDLIYNPRVTRFVAQAQAAGAATSDGLAMLVHQGAEAFVQWTGIEPPADIMMAACEAVLGGK